MKLLLISDLHGNVDNLQKLEGEIKSADAVLFAGDFSKFKKTETGLPCAEKMRELCPNLFAVLGNCDEPELLESIEKLDISAQHALAWFEGLAIAGSGGGSKFTGETPNERDEDDLQTDFDVIKNSGLEEEGQWNNLILISHNPPKAQGIDSPAPNVHAGSQTFTDFIEKTKPLAVLCGHIHEGVGVEKIGGTVVVNPGPLCEGKYAVMEIKKDGDSWKVADTQLKSL
ncbi:MAG: metallophosphoesterase family protein [Treponema sp.]|nr:metallophosphoesterase family protein [Treponema sp.]